MIFDSIKNYKQYEACNDRMKKAFCYLKNKDFSKIEPGKYEIEGSDIYALVQQYDTKDMAEGRWEAHREYIDIQFVYSGEEIIGIANITQMKEKDTYNNEKDIQFFTGEGQLLKVRSGDFMVLFPEDIHMPCISINEKVPVRKVVVKVLI